MTTSKNDILAIDASAYRTARLARSGILAVGPARPSPTSHAAFDAELTSRNVLRGLRDKLDSVDADPVATRREKQHDGAKAIQLAREQLDRAAIKARNADQALRASVRRIDDTVKAIEAKQSPMAILRLQQRAANLQQLSERERMAILEKATENADVDTALAVSLVPESADIGRRAIAAMTAKDDLAFVLDAGRATHAVLGAIEVARGGLDLLSRDPDSYRSAVAAKSLDTMVAASGGPASFGSDPQQFRDPLTPSWLQFPMPPQQPEAQLEPDAAATAPAAAPASTV
jgi:hypothetical protein